MQPINQDELKQLIEEAKKEGKDVSKLEEEASIAREAVSPPSGEVKETQTEKGVVVIESTGPAREEDFE